MDKSRIKEEIKSISMEYGEYIFDFINLLVRDFFESENEEYRFIKDEDWHSLDLDNYDLWAVSDNGDYFWWNGSQTIIMNARNSKYISLPSTPHNLINSINNGYDCDVLPKSLGLQNV